MLFLFFYKLFDFLLDGVLFAKIAPSKNSTTTLKGFMKTEIIKGWYYTHSGTFH